MHTWFELGVQLNIAVCDLLAIKQDYRETSDCRLQMLIKWEQLERPTWSKLISALVKIRRIVLAEDLATKYGKFKK